MATRRTEKKPKIHGAFTPSESSPDEVPFGFRRFGFKVTEEPGHLGAESSVKKCKMIKLIRMEI